MKINPRIAALIVGMALMSVFVSLYQAQRDYLGGGNGGHNKRLRKRSC